MTQQDLIKLIGLKSTDTELLAHFEQYGLAKPPKNLTSNNGGKIIYDKEHNLYYAFSFEVFNDRFYPPVDVGVKNPGHKFQAYLSEISFLYKEPSTNKPDPKEAIFWNLTPTPTASLKEVEGWFGQAESNRRGGLFFEKKLTNVLEVKAWYDDKKGMLISNWVSIIQHAPLISHYYLEKEGWFAYEAHLYAMLIKWLFDNRYLLLYEAVYQKDLATHSTHEVLNWTKQHLNSHVWDNQITNEHLLRSFMFEIMGNSASLKNEAGKGVNFNFIKLHLRLACLEEAYEKLNAGQEEERKDMLRSIVFNETNYNAFYHAMNDWFVYFKTLTGANINN